MSATTTQLLSSGEFYKLRYATIPVKSASANVSFYIPLTQKCKILSCDTLVANEQYIRVYIYIANRLSWWNMTSAPRFYMLVGLRHSFCTIFRIFKPTCGGGGGGRKHVNVDWETNIFDTENVV